MPPPRPAPATLAASAARGAGGDVVRTADDPFHTTGRIDWPGPNQYRSASGAPGPQYRQRRADSDTAVTLDTAARTVSGTVRISVHGRVTGVRLWPDPTVPDWNTSNDTWGQTRAPDPLGPVTGGGLTTPQTP